MTSVKAYNGEEFRNVLHKGTLEEFVDAIALLKDNAVAPIAMKAEIEKTPITTMDQWLKREAVIMQEEGNTPDRNFTMSDVLNWQFRKSVRIDRHPDTDARWPVVNFTSESWNKLENLLLPQGAAVPGDPRQVYGENIIDPVRKMLLGTGGADFEKFSAANSDAHLRTEFSNGKFVFIHASRDLDRQRAEEKRVADFIAAAPELVRTKRQLIAPEKATFRKRVSPS